MKAPATKTDRLLEGEDPNSQFGRDARHWISVYREMIAFKEDLLARVSGQLEHLPRAARQDVLENDIGMLEEQLQRYRRRLDYWYERQWVLEGLHIDASDRTVSFRDKSITLTKREYQLFVLLATRSPEYIAPQRLLAEAWHDGHLPEETLRTYIARLRGKLTSLGARAEIKNRPRRGYAVIFSEHR